MPDTELADADALAFTFNPLALLECVDAEKSADGLADEGADEADADPKSDDVDGRGSCRDERGEAPGDEAQELFALALALALCPCRDRLGCNIDAARCRFDL